MKMKTKTEKQREEKEMPKSEIEILFSVKHLLETRQCYEWITQTSLTSIHDKHVKWIACTLCFHLT
jgi:hypothetical protein